METQPRGKGSRLGVGIGDDSDIVSSGGNAGRDREAVMEGGIDDGDGGEIGRSDFGGGAGLEIRAGDGDGGRLVVPVGGGETEERAGAGGPLCPDGRGNRRDPVRIFGYRLPVVLGVGKVFFRFQIGRQLVGGFGGVGVELVVGDGIDGVNRQIGKDAGGGGGEINRNPAEAVGFLEIFTGNAVVLPGGGEDGQGEAAAGGGGVAGEGGIGEGDIEPGRAGRNK